MSTVKALVVDDSKIMRSQVKRALTQISLAEFEFEEAMDGEDALGKFNDEIDMLFVDWNMPKMTGVEFARAVRDKGYSNIPIIMVTAEKSMGKVDKALNEGGADEYITKPFTPDKMEKTISKFFNDNGELVTQIQEEKKSFFSSILK